MGYPRSGSSSQLTSLVLPAYNPGPDIERIWFDIRRFVIQAPGNWEVVIVSDGCTDGTNERVQVFLERDKDWATYIAMPRNRGKGAAVRTGLDEARGRWRIFTDVDLSYGLDGVLRVAEKLWQGHDVVVGSRLLPDSSFVIPAFLQDYAYRRRIQSSVYSTFVRWLLPLNLTDTQAGLKGFSAAVVEKMLPHLHCDGFSFDAELLMACRKLGYEIPEVPVQFVFHDSTTTNFRKSLRMLGELWQIRQRFRHFKSVDQAQPDLPPLKKSA